MKYYRYIIALLTVAITLSCKHKQQASLAKPSFASVTGIHFTEVRRAFNTGLVFNNDGYQLEASWKLYFLNDDSVRLYNQDRKRDYDFHVYFDHDSVLNMANTWLRLRKINKDSILFQVLSVGTDSVISHEFSNVYMTFYADSYSKRFSPFYLNRLKSPASNDTLLIRKKAIAATLDSGKAFAARQPVILKSKNPLLTVEKEKQVKTLLNDIDPADYYMSPAYDITIHKAYENFSYSFKVIVDARGRLYYDKSMIYISPEFKKSTEAVLKGIVNGYLTAYMRAVPGNTLSIPHASKILLNVVGIKD